MKPYAALPPIEKPVRAVNSRRRADVNVPSAAGNGAAGSAEGEGNCCDS
jgi:hypothetical protein